MKYKLVIFDFDGTLADTFPMIISYINKDPSRFGSDGITESEVKKIRDMSFYYFLKEFNFHLLKIKELVSEIREYLYKEVNNIKIFPKLANTLKILKEKETKVVILTTNTKEIVEDFLALQGLDKYVDNVISELDPFAKKSHIQKLLREYNIDESEAVMVGDEFRDINAARDAGVDSIGVTWGFSSKKALEEHTPTYIAESVVQLDDIIFYGNN